MSPRRAPAAAPATATEPAPGAPLPPPLELRLVAQVGGGATTYDVRVTCARGEVRLRDVPARDLRSYGAVRTAALAARRPVALPDLGRHARTIWDGLVAAALAAAPRQRGVMGLRPRPRRRAWRGAGR